MLLCVLGSLPKALHDAALRKAIKTSKQAVIDRVKQLQVLLRKKRPVMTSAAVDIKTGEVYLDESGFIPENLNKLM